MRKILIFGCMVIMETRFGKGSYFAKEASYSHSFSKPDYNGFNYMFIAQVLVGEYIQVKFCFDIRSNRLSYQAMSSTGTQTECM